MTDHTDVELYFDKGKAERWIRFGRIRSTRVIDSKRKVVSFAAGDVFAYVRWAANEYGTIASRIDILCAVAPHEAFSTVPGVTPGGEILLRIVTWTKVQKVFAAIDTVEALGFDPAEIAPDHWRQVHNRISGGHEPRPYTKDQHHAWLLRRQIDSGPAPSNGVHHDGTRSGIAMPKSGASS